MIPLTHILILSALLFSIGVLGVMLRRNVIVIFMSIELMLNAVNLSFIGFARSLDSMTGVVFIFFIIPSPIPINKVFDAAKLGIAIRNVIGNRPKTISWYANFQCYCY